MKKRKTTLLISLIIGLIFFEAYSVMMTQSREARFRVFALGNFLHAYGLVKTQELMPLTFLPAVHLVSYGDGLIFKSEEMRKRIIDGYVYDLAWKDSGKFVISASPLRSSFLQAEFGMLEDMNLRMNVKGVDSAPDSYEEVAQWPILPAWYDLRTLTGKQLTGSGTHPIITP